MFLNFCPFLWKILFNKIEFIYNVFHVLKKPITDIHIIEHII